MSNVTSILSARTNRKIIALEASSDMMLLELDRRMQERRTRRAEFNLKYLIENPGQVDSVPYPEELQLSVQLQARHTPMRSV